MRAHRAEGPGGAPVSGRAKEVAAPTIADLMGLLARASMRAEPASTRDGCRGIGGGQPMIQ